MKSSIRSRVLGIALAAVLGFIAGASSHGIWNRLSLSADWSERSANIRSAPLFSSVHSGSVVVYDVKDLTNGDQAVSNQLVKLLHDTVDPDSWADRGGKTAAMLVTTNQLTIKASAESHLQIQGLLDQVRATRTLNIAIDYRIVESDLSPTEPDRTFVDVDPQSLAEKFGTLHEMIAASRLIVANGTAATLGSEFALADSHGVALPAVVAIPTVSRDRKSVTISFKNAAMPNNPPTRQIALVSIRPDSTGILRIGGAASRQLIVFRTKIMETHLIPAGSGAQSDNAIAH